MWRGRSQSVPRLKYRVICSSTASRAATVLCVVFIWFSSFMRQVSASAGDRSYVRQKLFSCRLRFAVAGHTP